MFESVTPDRGADGLTRSARILYVLAIMIAISTALFVITAVHDGRPWRPVSVTLNIVFIIVAWITARGIERQKRWAKWLGYAIGIMQLINLPLGPIVGIAVLVYVRRASKAGLFRASEENRA